MPRRLRAATDRSSGGLDPNQQQSIPAQWVQRRVSPRGTFFPDVSPIMIGRARCGTRANIFMIGHLGAGTNPRHGPIPGRPKIPDTVFASLAVAAVEDSGRAACPTPRTHASRGCAPRACRHRFWIRRCARTRRILPRRRTTPGHARMRRHGINGANHWPCVAECAAKVN